MPNERELTLYKAITSILLTILLVSCVSTSESEIPRTLELKAALRLGGHIRLAIEPPESKGHLVVIKDRHSTQPGNHRLRPQLRQVQYDNRRLVSYLVQHGFDLLGCEQTWGELKETPKNASQYRLVRSRIRYGSNLDEFALYQPVLFQLLWPKKLQVWGMEDPDLFAEDIEDFKTYVKARQQARRNDLSDSQRKQYQKVLLATLNKLRLNIAMRGTAAAKNLLKLVQDKQSTKAILLVGGAHVPAALEVLKESGFHVYVFESSRYATEKDSEPADE